MSLLSNTCLTLPETRCYERGPVPRRTDAALTRVNAGLVWPPRPGAM